MASGAAAAGVTVTEMIRHLASTPLTCSDDDGGAGLMGRLRELEDLKSAAAAAQARATVAFDRIQRRKQKEAGMPAAELGTGVAAQIALARRESPRARRPAPGTGKSAGHRNARTLAALEAGNLHEWRATLLVRETACLPAEDRVAVDAELAPDTGTFTGTGNRHIISAARAFAYRRDPRSVTRRASHAATERRVSLRQAPDTMCYLTALLPVAQGVAIHTALTRHADTARSARDPRSRSQLMAGTEPARLPGYGIVPAGWARTLLTNPEAATGPAPARNTPNQQGPGLDPHG